MLQYFSTYIVLWGFLYYLKLIKFNPFIWVLIAFITSIFVILYLLFNNVNLNILLLYIIKNSPKILLLIILNKNNLYEGFNFGLIWFIIYLICINMNLKKIYYDDLIVKLLNSTYKFK
jgi:hypothetical protein